MNQAVYDKLVTVAKARSLISYTELARVAGLDLSRRLELDELVAFLEEIAMYETQAGRPLLVALVIREATNMPGGGLFKFAKKHGLQKKDEDDIVFFTKELSRVYQHWAGQ